MAKDRKFSDVFDAVKAEIPEDEVRLLELLDHIWHRAKYCPPELIDRSWNDLSTFVSVGVLGDRELTSKDPRWKRRALAQLLGQEPIIQMRGSTTT